MPLTEEEKKKLDYINSKGGNIVKEGQKNAFESGKLTSSWVSGSQSRSDYSRMQNNIYEDKRNTASKRKSAQKSASPAYQDASKKQQSLSDKVQKKQQQKAVVDSAPLSETPSQPQQTYQQQQNQVQTAPDKKNALSYLEQQTTGQQTTQQVRELQLKKAQRQADEQLKAAENAQKDNEIFLSDYDEISAMSPQEIQELEAYTTARDQGHSDNPLTEFYLQSKRKKTAGSLLKKYGQKRLDELAETYGRARHQQQEQEIQQKAKEDVSSTGGAVTRSIGTVVTAPLQGAMSVKGRLDELSNRTGRYSTLESFVPMDAARVYNNTVRSEVAQNIAGDGSNPLRKGAAVLYQAGIGTVGSLANAIVLGPGVGMAVNATNQFAQTVAEASAQGATPEQAYLYATANAAVDALTDKIPLDQLANVALAGNTNVFVNMLKQAGIEASNEGASILGSYIAEAAILKDSSQYSQSVEAYMDQALSEGMFETEAEARAWAERQADKDVLAQAEQQLLVAGISGGASGAVAAIKGNAAQKQQDRQEKAAQAIQAEAERQQLEKTGGQMSMDQVQPQKTPLTPEDVQRQDQAITDTIDQVRDGQLGMEQLPDQPLQTPQQPEAQQPNTVSDIVEQMVRENQAQKMTPEQIQDIVQEAVSGGQGKAEEQKAYQAAKAQAKARKDLEKEIVKTQKDVEAGKGSPARLRQLQDRLAQMDVDTLNFPKTRQEAINEQIQLIDALDKEQHAAYIRRETGETTNRPNKVATNRRKAAVKELDRLRAMSDDDYHAELVDSGILPPDGMTFSDVAANENIAQGREELAQRNQTRQALDKATSGLAALLPNGEAQFDQYAQQLSGALRQSSTPDPLPPQAPESVGSLQEATDFLRQRLEYEKQPKNKRVPLSEQPYTQPTSTQDVANSDSVRQNRPDPNRAERSIQQSQTAVSPEQAVQDTVQKMVEQKSTQAAQGPDKMVQDVAQNVVQNEAATPEQPTPEQLVQNAAEEATRAARGETVEPVASVGGGGATPPADTLGMQNAPSGDTEKSRSVTNSGLNSQDPDIRAGYQQTLQQDPKAGDHQIKHNADTLSTAQQRTSTPERVRAEYDYLMQKQDSWTAEDAATGRLVAKELFKSGDADGVTAMNKQLARVATNAGQVSQAFAITGTMRDAADPQSAVESATARIMAMKQENTTYDPGKSGQTFDQWKDSIAKEYTRLGMAVENIPDGDTNAMRDVIRQIAKSRKTTAWFGTSDKLAANAERILKKLDFDTLKRIADTQIAAMPDDFRKRTKVEISAGLRKQSMLSSLKTFGRNIAGNTATGFLDSASDSTTGYLVDSMLSKVTGKRTVGNDLARSKEYMDAAKDAADFASLCVELNVPIETDANAAFDSATAANRSGKFIGKTFRSNGNFMMRFLYGYQKYMSYALEVSDKVFEGGTNSAVTESLNRLKDSGLSDADVQQLAEYTANRRTFKDATWEENGKVHGSNMSRVAQNIKNIGKGTDAEPFVSAATDVVMPFASVPMNVKQTGIDYKIGIAKGAYEICKIISDARHGKEINVARQRQAVSDFSRGTTGLVLTSIMTVAAGKGIIQVHDDSDKNKKAMEQSEGLSGAQFNWSAFSRSLDGGSEKWQSGDIVSSADFLEPFNDQMYLGAELAKDDSVREFLENPSFETVNPAMAKAWAKGSLLSTASSFLDSPMMDGLSQMSDLISSAITAVGTKNVDDVKNAAYEYAGSAASSFIPQFVRQAAQTKDGYYRDTRGEDSAEYAKNSVLNALPGASESLPKKVNGFGEEQKRGGFVSNFLDPTNTQKLKLNEVSDDLAELSQSPDVSNIYPERQAPLTVKNAVGEEVRLTGEQRETYQKEYGEKASGYYKGLMGSKYFKALPDELKGDALQKAKEYAADSARASVTDYKATERGNTRTVVDEIVGEVVKTKATSTMTSLETAWKKGMDTSVAEKELSALYGTYGKQSETIQKAIMDAAEGNTKKYLEGRQSGLSSQKTLSALKSVQSVPAENRGKIGYQLQAIAGTKGLSEEDMDAAMKLYMPDYDPSANEPDVVEVVYDYLRKEKGYSAEDYASFKYAYNLAASDYGDKNGKVKKDEYISAMLDMGYDQATAKEIFDTLWNGSSKRHKAIQQQALDLYG